MRLLHLLVVLLLVATAAIAVGMRACGLFPGGVHPTPTTAPAPEPPGVAVQLESPDPTVLTYVVSCDLAQELGLAPIAEGEPGYRTSLDSDGDGVACETSP